MNLLTDIAENLANVKRQSPLVHHLTNYVTVNDCANVVLALGGSPVMADDIDEVAEMAALAAALVLNIGTLNARTIEAMLKAGQTANKLNIPVIIDPVGAGATRLRTQTAERLLQQIKPAVIRGNASEIKILAGESVAIKGVDAATDASDGETIAQNLAQRLGCVIAITGKTDIISDGQRLCLIDNGHPMLSQVTGTGCMATSLVGTYCGATDDYFTAAAAGIMTMGLAGELAQQALVPGDGVGSFRVRLLDNIYNLTPESLLQGGKVKCRA
jgi:hydroxyethylthiazole kinase